MPAETRAQLHYQLAVGYDNEAETAGDVAFAEAQRHYAEALQVAPEDSPSRFDYAFGHAQCVLRNRRRSPADLEQARASLSEAIDRLGQRGEILAAFAQGVLAEIDLYLPGDRASKVERAIKRLEAALPVLERHPDRVTGRDMAIFLVRLGRAFEMRPYGHTEANLNTALAAYLRAAEACGPDEDVAEHTAALLDAAVLASGSTEIEDVLRSLGGLDALDAHKAPGRPPLERARDLAVRGGLRLHAFRLRSAPEDLAAAEAHYRAALAIPETLGDKALRAGLLANLGSVVVRHPRPPEDAEDLLREAVAAADAVAGEARVLARGNLGRFLTDGGRTKEAAPLLREALAELEADVAPDHGEPAVAQLARNASGPVEALIDALLWPIEAGRLDRDAAAISAALNAHERNKCRALGVSIAAERVARPAAVSPELWENYLAAVRARRRLSVETMIGRLGPARRQWMVQRPEASGRYTHVLDLAETQLEIRDHELTQTIAQEEALRQQIERDSPGMDLRAAWPEDAAAEATRLAKGGIAIVHFATTDRATYVFTTTGGWTRVDCAPALGAEALDTLLEVAWFGPYGRYRDAVKRSASGTPELFEGWRHAVASIGATLSRCLELGHLWQHLASEGVSEILFIPYRALHLVPLHLLEDEDGKPLCDRFAISYAPSLAIHATSAAPGGVRPERGLFVEDPDQTLTFAALDVRLAQTFVKDPAVLSGAACRAEEVVAAMQDADLMLFSGHAFLDADTPMRSALRLADRDVSMAEIAARVDLSTCRLALLSACETAQTSPTRRADEYAGLPGAFLRAGARTVVGTLWAVEDAACPFFDQAFCESMFEGGRAPRAAFVAALRRLRTLTYRDLPDLLATEDAAQLAGARRLLLHAKIAPDPDQPLFDHPVHWGAFCLIGGRDEGVA